MREQFIQPSSKNLQVFLKERKVKSVYEMAEIAEQYNEASNNFVNQLPEMLAVESDVVTEDSQCKQDSQTRNAGVIRKRYCYYCKTPSHYIRECPKINTAVRGKRIVGGAEFSDQSVVRGGRGGQRCIGRGK